MEQIPLKKDRPKSEWILRAVLVTLGVLLPLIAVEGFVRFVLDIREPHDPPGFYKGDPVTGWAKVPGSESMVYLYQDGTKRHVRNNSHGYTDRERELVKNKPRIVLVGDSTTEFWEVEEEQRGQFLLEEKLDHQWEVLNLGVRGFSTDQVYLLLKHTALKFSPDIVVYTFCINDLFGNTRRNKPSFELDPKNPDSLILLDFPFPNENEILSGENVFSTPLERLHHTLARMSFFYRKASMLLTRHPMGYFYRSLNLEDQVELTPYKKVYGPEDDYRMKLFFALIREMKAMLDERNVGFLLVEGVYGNVLDPDRKAWIVQEYGDVFDFGKVTRLMDDFTRENGIQFLSVQDKMQERHIPISDVMHPEDYVHLNAEGVRLYSDWVLEKIRSLGWVNPAGGG